MRVMRYRSRLLFIAGAADAIRAGSPADAAVEKAAAGREAVSSSSVRSGQLYERFDHPEPPPLLQGKSSPGPGGLIVRPGSNNTAIPQALSNCSWEIFAPRRSAALR